MIATREQQEDFERDDDRRELQLIRAEAADHLFDVEAAVRHGVVQHHLREVDRIGRDAAQLRAGVDRKSAARVVRAALRRRDRQQRSDRGRAEDGNRCRQRSGVTNTSSAIRKYAGLHEPDANPASATSHVRRGGASKSAVKSQANAIVGASADSEANSYSDIGSSAAAAMMFPYSGAARIASAISSTVTNKFAIRPP